MEEFIRGKHMCENCDINYENMEQPKLVAHVYGATRFVVTATIFMYLRRLDTQRKYSCPE